MTVCRLVTAHPYSVLAHASARVEIGAVAPAAAKRLQQRFRPLIHIDDLALGIEPEPHRGLLVAGVIDRELVVEDHLRRGIELLHLYIGCDGFAGRGHEM